jgi:hypothetical protein
MQLSPSPMTALGHKRPKVDIRLGSALPRTPDIDRRSRHVPFSSQPERHHVVAEERARPVSRAAIILPAITSRAPCACKPSIRHTSSNVMPHDALSLEVKFKAV